MAKVVYFASLRERLGIPEEVVKLESEQSVSQLIDGLIQRHGETWESVFQGTQVMVAVNQEMSDHETTVTDQDEIAFFPPVTGG